MTKIISINPYTEEKIKSSSLLPLSQASKKIQTSKKSLEKWKSTSIQDRCAKIKNIADILKKNKLKYAKLMTQEMGKPLKQAISEIEKCAWATEYFADNAPTFLKEEFIQTEAYMSYIRFDPLGLVLGIMPWNFPFWQVWRCAIPALCAGNVFLLKHSTNVPGCAQMIHEIFNQALPKGVFTSLLIDSSTATQIIEKNLIQGVSLTGSVEAGKQIAQVSGKNLKKTVLELGGSDPFIILEDANLQLACETAVQARTINSGQSCIAAKRFIIVEKKFKEAVQKILEATKSLKIGDPMQESTSVGPLARKDLVENLKNQVKKALQSGGKILYQTKNLPKKGFFFPPTLILCNKNNPILQEELFGPVFLLLKVKNEQEAIKVANATSFGLGASLWTQNLDKANLLAQKIEAGAVTINGMVKSDPRLPFGGIKNSGYGRELGNYGIKEFTNMKTVVVNK